MLNRGVLRPRTVVAALTLLAGALRLPLAAGQNLWFDEWATWRLMQRDSLTEMLRGVPETEGSPALFYLAEWVVTRVAGTGDLGLRVLPLLCGAALVPLAFALGTRLSSPAAGICAAALVAIHPWLVWLGAEARVYTLYLLLAAASMLLFLRVLERGDPARLAAWVAISALLVTTHYFSAFLILGQGVWLAARRPALRGGLLGGTFAIAAVAIATSPVWARELQNTEFFKELDSERLEQVVRSGLIGTSPPTWHLGVPAAIVALAAIGCFLWTWRRAPRPPAWQLAAATALAAAATAAAYDYVIARNVIGLWFAVAVLAVVGVVLADRRIGLAIASTGAVILALATGALLVDERLQKADWERAAALVGGPRPGLVVIAPGAYNSFPLGIYLGRIQISQGAEATEIVVVGTRPPSGRDSCGGPRCGVPAAEPQDPGIAGLALVERRDDGMWTTARFRASQPIAIDYATAERFLPGSGTPAFFVHAP